MQNISNQNNNIITVDNMEINISILKITAIWAFSESAFGGILHALNVPFRGLFISAAAVLFITLIILFSKNSKEIFKSTIIVILIKALVSPHTPLTAYLAVSIQGLLGYLLFINKNFYRLSAMLLGILTLLFSAVQKLVVLTVLFGNTLWKSINIFIKQLSKEFFSIGLSSDINYGHILIWAYITIHIAAGVFVGFYAGLLPKKLSYYTQQISKTNFDELNIGIPQKDKKKKKKNWFQRPTGIIFLIISILLLLFSYLSPANSGIASWEIAIMLIRSVLLTVLWYALLAPIVKRLFQKYLSKKKSIYAQEIDEIMNLFPHFRNIVSYCWKNSSDKKGFKRIHYFISTSFYYLLLS